MGPRNRRFDSDDGIEWIFCRICGDHRRVINSQHLSKHDTDREAYMEEFTYRDQLITKELPHHASSPGRQLGAVAH
jgi:hypothetical protein